MAMTSGYHQIVFCLCLGISLKAYAQPSSLVNEESYPIDEVEVLEPIVITGSKKGRALSDSPVKTELVQKEIIEQNHLSDLSQVLDNIPGITLQNLTGRMGSAAVIQGLSDERVLVLIDGVPQLQVSSSGYDLSQIAANDIQSVEVTKGASSALYGSQAMGGVINIITKKPTDKTKYFIDGKNTYTASEQIEGVRAVPNFVNTTLSGKALDLFLYKISFGQRFQGPIDLDETTLAQDMGETERYNLSSSITKKINKQQSLSFDTLFIDETLNLLTTQPTGSGFVPRQNASRSRTQNITAAHNYNFLDGSNLRTTLFFSQIKDELTLNDDPNTPYTENLKSADLNTLMAESQLDTSFVQGHETTLGLQYRYQYLDQINQTQNSTSANRNTEVDDQGMWSVESYAQHNMKVKKLEITPGLRGQYDSGFGVQASPSLNFFYKPNIFESIKTNFRSSVGVGYRVPSLKERFFLMDHRSLAGYIIEGSEDLNPERSLSYQLGIELIKSQSFTFHINGFFNQVRGMIGVAQTTGRDGNLIFNYENMDQVHSRGLEVSSSFKPLKNLTIEQDVTLSKTENVNGSFEVPLRPRTLYKFRGYVQASSKFLISLLFRFQSDEFLDIANETISPSFSALDLKFNYKHNKKYNLYAGVDNLFDETRSAAQDGQLMFQDNRPIMGRQFYVGLNFQN